MDRSYHGMSIDRKAQKVIEMLDDQGLSGRYGKITGFDFSI